MGGCFLQSAEPVDCHDPWMPLSLEWATVESVNVWEDEEDFFLQKHLFETEEDAEHYRTFLHRLLDDVANNENDVDASEPLSADTLRSQEAALLRDRQSRESALVDGRLLRYKKNVLLFHNNLPLQQFSFSFKNDRKERLLFQWSKHKDQYFTFPNLLKTLEEPDEERKHLRGYIRTILHFVLEGIPIDYDQETQTVAFLSHKKTILVPPQEANIMLHIYEFFLNHQKDITLPALTYDAHLWGYWDNGFYWHKGVPRCFSVCLETGRKFLGILGFIDVRIFGSSLVKKMRIWSALWKHVETDKCVHDPEYYNRTYGYGVTIADTHLMQELRRFTSSHLYGVFLRKVKGHAKSAESVESLNECERFIQQSLNVSPQTKDQIFTLCRKAQKTEQWDVWKSLLHLACMQPSNVGYNLEKRMFYWDENGYTPVPQGGDFLVPVFSLTQDYPDLSQREVSIVLRKAGFLTASLSAVGAIRRGLTLLGLCNTDCGDITLARKVVNSLILHNKKEKNQTSPACDFSEIPLLSEWISRVCSQVASWTKDSRILDLWRAYLSRKNSFVVLQKSEEDFGSAPLKRRKKDAQGAPELIIFQEIPALYHILKQEGVWAEASSEPKIFMRKR